MTAHAGVVHLDVRQQAPDVDAVSARLLQTVDYEKITAIRPETA